MDPASIAIIVVGVLNLAGVVVTALYGRRTNDAVNHKHPKAPTLRDVAVMSWEQLEHNAEEHGRTQAQVSEVMRRLDHVEGALANHVEWEERVKWAEVEDALRHTK